MRCWDPLFLTLKTVEVPYKRPRPRRECKGSKKKSENDDIEKENEELRKANSVRKATRARVKATRMSSKSLLQAKRANMSQP